MDKSTKQEYNRRHYVKNREQILNRAKTRSRARSKTASNVIPLFGQKSPKTLLVEKSGVLVKFLPEFLSKEVALLFALGTLMTYFLVTESVKFYLTVDKSPWDAYLKALIVEGIMIAFACLRGHTSSLRWGYRILLVAVGLFSLWTVSAKTVSESLTQNAAAVQKQKVITELETELTERSKVRRRLVDLDRLKKAQAYEESMTELRFRLEQARATEMPGDCSGAILNTLFTLVLFRVLVMISNLLCIKKLRRLLKLRRYAFSE